MNDDFFHSDQIDYDLLITGSMHWLIKRVLHGIAQRGLPGEHHLYITFDTTDSEVEIPDYLRKKYPHEMTIVLQRCYQNLSVSGSGFSVSLSFSGKSERLSIPFHALNKFHDPSCGFMLQLGYNDEEHMPVETLESVQEVNDPEIEIPSPGNQASEDSDRATTEAPAVEDNVVELDKFRKNKT